MKTVVKELLKLWLFECAKCYGSHSMTYKLKQKTHQFITLNFFFIMSLIPHPKLIHLFSSFFKFPCVVDWLNKEIQTDTLFKCNQFCSTTQKKILWDLWVTTLIIMLWQRQAQSRIKCIVPVNNVHDPSRCNDGLACAGCGMDQMVHSCLWMGPQAGRWPDKDVQQDFGCSWSHKYLMR